jgi:hypothetical protein
MSAYTYQYVLYPYQLSVFANVAFFLMTYNFPFYGASPSNSCCIIKVLCFSFPSLGGAWLGVEAECMLAGLPVSGDGKIGSWRDFGRVKPWGWRERERERQKEFILSC